LAAGLGRGLGLVVEREVRAGDGEDDAVVGGHEGGAAVDKLIAASQMTKDAEAPARAFTAPTSMAADPEDPRIVVAATADLRNKSCYLSVSRDAGHTWHFSEEPPTDPSYPYCTNTSAGTPHASVAWGRNGTLYYAHLAYGEGEGPRENKSSAILAKSTNLGKTWTTTLVQNNRGASGPNAKSVTTVPGLAVDTSGPRDIVSVGFSQSYPEAPTGDPLRAPHVMVATSTDAGATFGEPVDLNTFDRPTLQAAGKSYQLFMRTGFGAGLRLEGDLLVGRRRRPWLGHGRTGIRGQQTTDRCGDGSHTHVAVPHHGLSMGFSLWSTPWTPAK
jgi:hypothetical protein